MTIDIGIYTDYYIWLKDQIQLPQHKTYNTLLAIMFHTEFVWIIPNDDNRIVDALDLRIQQMGTHAKEVLNGATVLEVLIAVSRRLEFNAGRNAPYWAWHLIKNLGLGKMSDPLSNRNCERVESILSGFIWRTYSQDGRGGLFPLKDAKEDQTKVEIWYQMNAYIIENHYI
jgi:hypothetical protein